MQALGLVLSLFKYGLNRFFLKYFVFCLNHINIYLAMVKEQGIEEVAVADNCSKGWKWIKKSQRTEDEHSYPVKNDNFLGVQSNWKVAMPADNCKAAQIPAIECCKRVHSKER